MLIFEISSYIKNRKRVEWLIFNNTEHLNECIRTNENDIVYDIDRVSRMGRVLLKDVNKDNYTIFLAGLSDDKIHEMLFNTSHDFNIEFQIHEYYADYEHGFSRITVKIME